MRWYFLSFSSFSAFRSPEIDNVPPSTLSLTSSFFIPGSSAFIRYSFSFSSISTGGIHSAKVNPSSASLRHVGQLRPSNDQSLFCISSISRNGSHDGDGFDGFHLVSLFI